MMLTPEELAEAERRLRNPAPGSKIAAARDFGVDLTLLIEKLHMTPEARLRRLEDNMVTLHEFRQAAKRLRT
jgi:hypothetical protein